MEKTPLRGTQLLRSQLLGVRGWLCSGVLAVAVSARLCIHSAIAAFCPRLKGGEGSGSELWVHGLH